MTIPAPPASSPPSFPEPEALRQWIRLDAETGYHYGMGNALLAQGAYEAAFQAYQRVLELVPDHPRTLANLAVLFSALGDAGTGAQLEQQVLAHGDPDGDGSGRQVLALAALDLGLTLTQQEQHEAAEIAFRRALIWDPDQGEAHVCLGDALLWQDKLELAGAAYQDACRVAPAHPRAGRRLLTLADAWYERAQTRIAAGDLPQAAAACRAALALDPRRDDALILLAVALERQGETTAATHALVSEATRRLSTPAFRTAEEPLRLAIALVPAAPLTLVRLAHLRRLHGAFAESAFWCRQALSLEAVPSPVAVEALVHLGLARYRLEMLVPALTVLELALELAPAEGLAHYGRALALEAQNRLPEALEAIARALWLIPEKPFVHACHGRLQQARGALEEALEAFAQTLRRSPDQPVGLRGQAQVLTALARFPEALAAEERLGQAMLAVNDFGQALAAYRRARTLPLPLAPAVLARLRQGEGLALAGLGQVEPALAALRAALAADPLQAETHAALADLLTAQGQNEAASLHRQQARAIAPLLYRDG